jgi:hypothetical protein
MTGEARDLAGSSVTRQAAVEPDEILHQRRPEHALPARAIVKANVRRIAAGYAADPSFFAAA